MIFMTMLIGIFGSYLFLKPYEEPDGTPPETGLTLWQRVKRQMLRL